MILNGFINLEGQFRIVHRRDGKILSDESIKNTTTKSGFKEIAGLINEDSSGGFKWIALDASSTKAVNTDTSLASEVTGGGMPRAEATATKTTTTNPGDTAQLVHTFTATGTQAVYGVGVFDSSSNGVMDSRTTFAVKNMASADTLEVTHKLKVA